MLRFVLALVMSIGTANASPPKGLNGAWTVDLSTDPAKPYTQPMALTLREDGTVAGSFYGSEIQAGRWKEDRGRLCASFRTTDGAGPYHSSVCVAGNQAQGQTWAEHRNFLFNWNATRTTGSDGPP